MLKILLEKWNLLWCRKWQYKFDIICSGRLISCIRKNCSYLIIVLVLKLDSYVIKLIFFIIQIVIKREVVMIYIFINNGYDAL